MKSPITDALATVFILLTLIAGGYFYLRSEADKVLQHKQQRQLHPEKVYEKTAMEKLSPKSFEALSKRTE